MKFLLMLLMFAKVFHLIFMFSYVILDSAPIDCRNDDNCTDYCEFEELKLEPGTANLDSGKCIAVYCRQDFTISVQTCDDNNATLISDCLYEHNFTMPYPICCNQIPQFDNQTENCNFDELDSVTGSEFDF